jgi:hypothetical protein
VAECRVSAEPGRRAADTGVGVVAGDGRVGLEPLQLHRQPNLQVELADPGQQPGQVLRWVGVAAGLVVGERVQTGAYAPPDVEQE